MVVTARVIDLAAGWLLRQDEGWCRIEAVTLGGATRRRAYRNTTRLWVNLGDRLRHLPAPSNSKLTVAAPADEVPEDL